MFLSTLAVPIATFSWMAIASFLIGCSAPLGQATVQSRLSPDAPRHRIQDFLRAKITGVPRSPGPGATDISAPASSVNGTIAQLGQASAQRPQRMQVARKSASSRAPGGRNPCRSPCTPEDARNQLPPDNPATQAVPASLDRKPRLLHLGFI